LLFIYFRLFGVFTTALNLVIESGYFRLMVTYRGIGRTQLIIDLIKSTTSKAAAAAAAAAAR
jgi:hypothetical protein